MESCDIIFSHNEYSGAKYESGRESNNGVLTPVGPVIISGHSHSPQEVGNAHFPGSLVQGKFVERMQMTYGMCTIDVDTKNVEYVRNHGSRHYVLCTSIEDALQYKPNEVLIKLYSDEDREAAALALANYTFMHKKPPVRKMEGEEVEGVAVHEIHEPDDLLREFVSEAKPEAMSILAEVIGEAK
jgi:hypothetical protein